MISPGPVSFTKGYCAVKAGYGTMGIGVCRGIAAHMCAFHAWSAEHRARVCHIILKICQNEEILDEKYISEV